MIVRETTGEATRTGNVRNMKVWINSSGRLRVGGSLTTFAKGTNTWNMTLDEAQTAVAELTDALGVVAADCRLSRLDIASTIQVEHSPADYCSIAFAVPMAERFAFKTSVGFRNSRRTIQLYDKARQKKVGTDDNLLRFEVQYKKGLSAQFCEVLSLASLCRRELWTSTIGKRWLLDFESIRVGTGTIVPVEGATPRELTNSFAASAVVNYGWEKTNALLSALPWTPQKKSRARTQLLHLVESSTTTFAEDLHQEMRTKLMGSLSSFTAT